MNRSFARSFQTFKFFLYLTAPLYLQESKEHACLSCAVRTYMLNQLKCLYCQQYEHVKSTYRESVIHALCVEVGHDNLFKKLNIVQTVKLTIQATTMLR